MIEEVLPLVPEGWRDTVKVLLMSTSDFDSRLFLTHLSVDLTLKFGQPPNVTDISTCLSAIEKKLKVSEKLCKDLWWLPWFKGFIATRDQVCILFRIVLAFIFLLN